MTNSDKTFSRVSELVGQNLTDIGANYEILILKFGEYEVHVSGFARIINGRNIMLTTNDYHSSNDKDYRHNDMYFNIAKFGSELIGRSVINVDVSPINDLFIKLDNEIRIEIFNSSGNLSFSHETEHWFLYKPEDKSFPYISVSSLGVECEFNES